MLHHVVMTTQIIKTDLKRNKSTPRCWKSCNFKAFSFYFLSPILPPSSFFEKWAILIEDYHQVKTCRAQWLRELWTKPSPPRTRGKSEWDERGFLFLFLSLLFAYLHNLLFKQLFKICIEINRYQTLWVCQGSRAMGAVCSTCSEILLEFQEPSAMTCLCFSIKIKELLLTVPMAREK